MLTRNENMKWFGMIAAFVLCLPAVVAAQPEWLERAKLLASDGAADDLFSYGVSISGDYAIVGACWDDSKSGSAYIYKRNGANWVQEAKLTASDRAAGDYFGHSVSISGDYAIVGTCNDDDRGYNSGSAYIFRRDGESWTMQAKLTASDGAAWDQFGLVSVKGNYVIVGAFNYSTRTKPGSAYIFERDGESWTEQAKLIASDGAAGDCFGHSVSTNGNYAIVGASFDDNEAGSAYVFKRYGASWSQVAKLTASDRAAKDYMGYGSSVSINSDYAFAGAMGHNNFTGSVYVFEKPLSGWVDATETARLDASDGAVGDDFGSYLSTDGEYVVVGARHDDSKSGSAYIFKHNGTSWTEEVKILASDRAVSDVFGHSVSISGDYTILGAHGDDDNGSASGSAYIFQLVLIVEIDIKPGSYPNAINLGSHGLIPVAILSDEEFDATTVDPETVELAGAGVEVRGKSNKYMAHEEDVNGDGLIDLAVQVATANLEPGLFQDGGVFLTGNLFEGFGGTAIEGWDEITIVPPKK